MHCIVTLLFDISYPPSIRPRYPLPPPHISSLIFNHPHLPTHNTSNNINNNTTPNKTQTQTNTPPACPIPLPTLPSVPKSHMLIVHHTHLTPTARHLSNTPLHRPTSTTSKFRILSCRASMRKTANVILITLVVKASILRAEVGGSMGEGRSSRCRYSPARGVVHYH